MPRFAHRRALAGLIALFTGLGLVALAPAAHASGGPLTILSAWTVSTNGGTLIPGTTATLTVTLVNTSSAEVPTTYTDDFSDVLDSSGQIGDPPGIAGAAETPTNTSSDPAHPAWNVKVPAGGSTSFIYQFYATYDGDNDLTNKACIPAANAQGDACASPATSTVEMSRLDVSLTESPGTSPKVGDPVSWTVTASNPTDVDWPAQNLYSGSTIGVLLNPRGIEGDIDESSGTGGSADPGGHFLDCSDGGSAFFTPSFWVTGSIAAGAKDVITTATYAYTGAGDQTLTTSATMERSLQTLPGSCNVATDLVPISNAPSQTSTVTGARPAVSTWDVLQAAITAAGSTPTTITLAAGADISGGGLTLPQGSNITIDLNGATLTLTGAYGAAGITDTGATLTVADTSTSGQGVLIATGGTNAAGIGGDAGADAGSLTITGGTVTATGGQLGAGIGGGRKIEGSGGVGGSFSMSAGSVTATGGEAAAGIGGGNGGSAGTIRITGGTVSASGGEYAAGIGGGNAGGAGAIRITGGAVSASGGAYAAGVGGGVQGSGGTVTIGSSATVTAGGGQTAIGAGYDGDSFGALDNAGTLTINSDTAIPSGTTVHNTGTIAVATGTLVNNGTIVEGPSATITGAVSNNSFHVTYGPKFGDGITPTAQSVYAATVAASQQSLATPTPGYEWAASDGTAVTDSTDLAALAGSSTGTPVTIALTERKTGAWLDLAITSTLVTDGNDNSVPDAGDVIRFTYTVTDNGPAIPATPGITFSESHGWTPAIAGAYPISHGAAAVFTHDYTVTQADIDTHATIASKATATTTYAGGASSSQQEATAVVAAPAPSIESNVATPTGTIAKAGDTVSVTIQAKNTGNTTLNDIKITDPAATLSGTCTAATLAPRATTAGTCTATYTVTQAQIDAGGNLTIQPTVSGTPEQGAAVTDDTASRTVALPARAPAVSVTTTKSGLTKDANGDKLPEAGDEVTFTYEVKNTGNVTLASVALTRNDATKTPIDSSSTPLAPGDSLTFHDIRTVTQDDVDQQRDITSDVIANAVGVLGSGTAPQVESKDPGIKVAPIVATIHATDTVTLKVDDDANKNGTADVGDVLTFTYTATNKGDVGLDTVGLADPLTGAVYPTAGSLSLAPGASVSVDGRYTVTQADVDAQARVVSHLTVIGTPHAGDRQPIVDHASVGAPVAPAAPALTIATKADPLTTSKVGDPVTLTYTVKNTGNVTLSGIRVSDVLVPTTPGAACASTLAPSASTTCTATYAIQQGDIDNGVPLVSKATVWGAFGNMLPTDTSAAIQIAPPVQHPGSSTSSSAALTTDQGTPDKADAGDVVTVWTTVTNTGNTTLPNVNGAPLAPGKSSTTSSTYAITQADVDAGHPIYGFAVPSAAPELSSTVTESLATDNDHSGTPDAGDTVTYTYTVTNTGNVTISGVGVSLAPGDTVEPTTNPSLAPGESATFTVTHVVTAAEDTAGRLDGAEDVTGSAPGGAGVTGHSGVAAPLSVFTKGHDSDGDGLSDKAEKAGCTDPTKADTDGDGLSDGAELEGFVMRNAIRSHGHVDAHRRVVTDPCKADTDGDGLSDGAELRGVRVHQKVKVLTRHGKRTVVRTRWIRTVQLDPTRKDTDGDGLSDAQEVAGLRVGGKRVRTNPIDWDTDADQRSDAAEVRHGANPDDPRNRHQRRGHHHRRHRGRNG